MSLNVPNSYMLNVDDTKNVHWTVHMPQDQRIVHTLLEYVESGEMVNSLRSELCELLKHTTEPVCVQTYGPDFPLPHELRTNRQLGNMEGAMGYILHSAREKFYYTMTYSRSGGGQRACVVKCNPHTIKDTYRRGLLEAFESWKQQLSSESAPIQNTAQMHNEYPAEV